LDRASRNEALNNSRVDFDEEDNGFYDIDKKVKLEERLIECIQKNRTHFYFSGHVLRPRGY
jgi:hypothetical protein